MKNSHSYRPGDWTEVRPIGEVLETLDEKGCLDALPFMLEMTRYCGQRFQVIKSAAKACNPGSGSGARRMAGAVNLGTGCDGSAHEGCKGGCLVFWKPDWLKPVDGPAANSAVSPSPHEAEIERLRAATRYATGEGGKTRNRCQVWDSNLAGAVPRQSLAAAAWRFSAGALTATRSTNPWLQLLPEPETLPPAADRCFIVDVQSDSALVMPQWQELEPAATAFQTRAWLLPLYRIVAAACGASPVFVTVRQQDSGRPVMFFPLCLWRKAGVRVLEFADFGLTDYNLPIIAPDLHLNGDETQAIWSEICSRLPKADIVRFTKMPGTLSGHPNPLAQLDWLNRMDLRSWTVPLPGTRADYDNVMIKAKDRKEHRRKRRNLEAQLGALSFVVAATEEQRRAIFRALTEHRRARFKVTGRTDMLADPVYQRFYEAVAFESSETTVALSALMAQDRPVATLYGVAHNESFLLLLHSFEVDLERLSPGIVALNDMITTAIESGKQYFDFTIGNEPYKRQFGVQAGLLFDGLYPLSAKGCVAIKLIKAAQHFRSPSHRRLALWHRAVAGCETAIKARLRKTSGTAA